ncbi:MAG TPA: DUF1345 domain-containing protein [Allosphingosinicella sp.]|nr:DUF1345 domain-containing protein [Allosphingosinicella sp.]
MARTAPRTIGNIVAPARFILFVLALAASITLTWWCTGDLPESVMIGFDLSAFCFLLSCIPLLARTDAKGMRADAAANDARRTVLLAITALVLVVILVVVAKELGAHVPAGPNAMKPEEKVLIIATLLIAWLFSNMIYALHYAHLSYREPGREKDIDFPRTDYPTYWDFVYFAFTLGMTFQTSDVAIRDPRIRRVVTFHCLAAFIFNLGVLAFTINVLGGG